MPSLTRVGNNLVLSLGDTPTLASNLRTRMFLLSIVGYEQGDGDVSFLFKETEDLIKLARVIQDTVYFFEKQQMKCNLDRFCNNVVTDFRNAQENFLNASLKGLEVKNSSSITVQLPVDFRRSLLQYQIKPVKHILEVGHAANFSVPGSGKTTIAYAAFALWRNSEIIEKLVVIGPRSSFMSWEDEFVQCFGGKPRSIRLDGDSVQNIVESCRNKELILCTYQLMIFHSPELMEMLGSYNCLLVLDESHKVKRISGGAYSSSVLRLAPYARRRLILTGTPMPHSPRDLWTQMTFLWPYRNLMGEAGVYKRQVQRNNGLGEYRDRINPFYTRIRKDDLGLRTPSVDRQIVRLSRYQRAIYDAIEARTLQEIESLEERDRLQIWRRNKMVRLLQAASNPSLLNEFSREFEIPPLSGEGLPVSNLIDNYTDYEMSSKLARAAELAKGLINSGEKVIIWTSFIHNIDTLKDTLLADMRPLHIYGSVPTSDEQEDEVAERTREQTIREFKNDADPRILIANPSSCAESVSLHKNERGEPVCKTAIYVDRTFDAGQYMQSLDRIHRIGMNPNTQVRYILLIGEGTIDQVVDARLDQKITNMMVALNDDFRPLDLENSISNISDQELNQDFESVYQYLRQRRMANNDRQSQGSQ